jgi:hypothetical protein
MVLKGDHLVLDFNTVYEGKDLSKLSEEEKRHEKTLELRYNEPQWNDDDSHNRDAQVIFDEN